jgi:hypothetical protein
MGESTDRREAFCEVEIFWKERPDMNTSGLPDFFFAQCTKTGKTYQIK